MPALDTILAESLVALEESASRRSLRATEAVEHGVCVKRDGKILWNFSGNDYLGLSRHPKVIEAGEVALKRYGAGAGASRLVSGNHSLYEELEAKLAALKGTEAALVFGSGYLTNLGVITALAGKGDLILADKLVHACLIDGARLSGAKLLRFPHNDVAVCRQMLDIHRAKHARCLILTDGVFSMDGDLAPLPILSLLAEEYDAWLLVDDAHGLGVVGGGRGSAFAFGPEKISVPLQVGTLSKAVGCYGGYICGSKTLKDYLVTTARSFIYSTALPPAVLASSIAALEIIASDRALVERPLNKARIFTASLNLPEAESAIVPLVLGDAEAALRASKLLEDAGFLAAAIRPPTVPEGTARLRFAFSALHEDADIERLAKTVRALV